MREISFSRLWSLILCGSPCVNHKCYKFVFLPWLPSIEDLDWEWSSSNKIDWIWSFREIHLIRCEELHWVRFVWQFGSLKVWFGWYGLVWFGWYGLVWIWGLDWVDRLVELHSHKSLTSSINLKKNFIN